MHNPESFKENDMQKFLWDFEIQTDFLVSAMRVDPVILFTQPLRSGRI